jgi:uncharacterized protein (DUF2236 family)
VSDDGYFPRGRSLLRHVHEQRAVGLLYGQRALAIGALAPLNFVGTMRHTRGRGTPFQRLARTATMFETIFFGTRADADRVLAAVAQMHSRVKGELRDDAGPVSAGTPYSAYDPDQMLWTVAVAADSARKFYELFVRRLSREERDAFWAEYVRFGELFGMPRAVAPRRYADLSDYLRARIDGPGAHLTDEAREVGRAILFHIPVPAVHAPAMRVHNLVMLGALPAPVRELYGLRYSAVDAAAFGAAVRALRAARPLAPRPMRAGSNRAFYEGVARTERVRLARGEAVRGVLA